MTLELKSINTESEAVLAISTNDDSSIYIEIFEDNGHPLDDQRSEIWLTPQQARALRDWLILETA